MSEILYILGNGGQGKVCADAYFEATGEKARLITSFEGLKQGDSFFVGLGDNTIRKKLIEEGLSLGLKLINIVHPTAFISKTACIKGFGCVLLPGAVLHTNAVINQGVILNSGCVVEHDCEVGEYSHISVNAAMGGGVRVGKGCLVGVNATILPNLSLGDFSVLAGGAVLTKSGGGVLVGNPARVKLN